MRLAVMGPTINLSVRKTKNYRMNGGIKIVIITHQITNSVQLSNTKKVESPFVIKEFAIYKNNKSYYLRIKKIN